MTDVSDLPADVAGDAAALEAVEQELFLTRQRLREADMALIEAAEQKDELRATAAALAVEVRDLRLRVGVAEAEVRRAETERAALVERHERRPDGADELVRRLSQAQKELVAAHESNNERDLQIDQLQLQIMELRRALAKARGFERP